MNLPEMIRTVRWMVRDTVRQSIATKLSWVMLAATVVGTVFCFSISVSGDPRGTNLEYESKYILPKAEAERIGREKVQAEGIGILEGKLHVLFGAIEVPIPRSRDDIVRMIHVWLAAFTADTMGILFALIWTAGFLPTFLEPQSASVLLAKPAPRWIILLGKYLGVVGFVALQAMLFIGLTWAALGLRTGVWDGTYWLAVPLLVMNFAVFYAVSAFLAVCTRSTVAAAFGTIVFWAICWAVNFTHHRMITFSPDGLSAGSMLLLDVAYWVLPKPLDMGGIFFDAMRAELFAVKPDELRLLAEKGQYRPELSVVASGLFAVGTLIFAAYEFETVDY
jgi:hypothetical protein